MSSFNKVFLMGNLTRDPQLKNLPSGSTATEFGIACNRKYKTGGGEDREEVTFVDVTAFGKTGEIINQYMSKGKPIFIEGRLKYDTWEKDGQKRSKLSVVVDNFQFIGGREAGGDGDQREYPRTRESIKSGSRAGSPFEGAAAGEGIPEADIPFAPNTF